jgi:hypothetical protein
VNPLSLAWGYFLSAQTPALQDAGTLDMTEFEEALKNEPGCEAEEEHPCGPVTHKVWCTGCGESGLFCAFAAMGRAEDMQNPICVCEVCNRYCCDVWRITKL